MSANKLRNLIWGAVSLTSLFWISPVWAEYALNLTRGVTPISKEVYDLHMLILWVVTVIAIIVFSVMCWSIYFHRKSRGAVAAQFHHSTAVEIAWTIIPIIILVVLAIPATKTLIFMEKTGDADMTLKVTGYQWKWKYDYLDEDLSFFSSLAQSSVEASQRGSGIDPYSIDNYLLEVDIPIVLPIKKKIRILTTANDVLHAWWVPALGWKRDAVPGFINDNWTYIEEAGTYRGQCTELCGKGHGFMPIVLKAVPEDEYRAWVETMKQEQAKARGESDKTFSKDELIAKGEQVYIGTCVACHMANGQGLPPAFPALVGGAITTGPISEHLNRVLNGKPGTAMQAFGEQLSDADIAAVITYERNSWGNAEQLAGEADLVQPAEVKAAKSMASM